MKKGWKSLFHIDVHDPVLQRLLNKSSVTTAYETDTYFVFLGGPVSLGDCPLMLLLHEAAVLNLLGP